MQVMPKSLWVLTVLVLISTLFTQVYADDEEEEGGGEEEEGEQDPFGGKNDSCGKALFNLVMGFVNGTLTCLGGKFQLQNIFELGTRFYCIVKCVMQTLDVIGEDGMLDEVSALFYFQGAIPPSIRESTIEAAQPCLALAAGFRPKEYYCPSYAPFVQCTLRSLLGSLGPYALDCFATPGLGLFFAILNTIVPASLYVPPAELRLGRNTSLIGYSRGGRRSRQRLTSTRRPTPIKNVTTTPKP